MRRAPQDDSTRAAPVPTAFVVTWERHVPAHVYVDRHYLRLGQIPASSFAVVVCIGVLEHVPDPQRLVDDCWRVLHPDGKLVLSASAVFPFHECPDDFFHFTRPLVYVLARTVGILSLWSAGSAVRTPARLARSLEERGSRAATVVSLPDACAGELWRGLSQS